MAEITIKSVEGNPLNINVVMTAVEHSMLNGELVTETVDFYPDTSKPVRAYLDCTTARKQYCPTTYVDGNIVYLSCDNATAGVYTLTVTCTDTNGKARRYKSDACIEVYDLTSAAEIAGTFDEQTYEMNGVFYTFGATVQSDWDETNPESPAYIRNKPDLSDYATDEELQAVEEQIPNVPEWAMQPQKPSYTPQEVGAASASQLTAEQTARQQADTTLLLGKQDVIQDLETIRSGAEKGATSVQPSDIVDSRGVFDLSVHNAVNGQLATYADLSAALTALNALESKYKYGGMSFKFVLTGDNKYVQARCMAQNFTTDVTQWQGVDDEPIPNSQNLVESKGVALSFAEIKRISFNPTLVGNAYIRNDKIIVADEGMTCVYMQVKAGIKIQISFIGTATIRYGFSNFIPQIGSTLPTLEMITENTVVDIPEGITYLTVSYNTANVSSITFESFDRIGNIESDIETLQQNAQDALHYSAQSLTDVQKAQARTNINAASQSDLQKLDDSTFKAVYRGNVFSIAELVSAGHYIGTVTDGKLVLWENAALNTYRIKIETDKYIADPFFRFAVCIEEDGETAVGTIQQNIEGALDVSSYTDAYYLYFSANLTSYPNFKVCTGNKITSLLYRTSDDLKITETNLTGSQSNKIISKKNTKFYSVGNNLFNTNAEDIRTGGFYHNNDWYEFANYNSTGIIQVKPNTTYVCSSNGITDDSVYQLARYIQQYNENGEYIAGADIEYGTIFTTGANTYYVKIGVNINHWQKFQVEEGISATAWQPYKENTIKNDSLDYVSIAEFANQNRKFNSLSGSATLAQNETLTLRRFYINRNIMWSAVLDGAIESFKVGLGYEQYSGMWFEVDATQVKVYYHLNSTTLLNTYNHGLTLGNHLVVSYNDNGNGTAVFRMSAYGSTFEQVINDKLAYGAGPAFVTNIGTSALNVGISVFPKDIEKSIWIFGDSYLSYLNPARWPYWIEQFGYKNYLLDNLPGEAAPYGYVDFQTLVTMGIPKYVVWGFGMNGGSDPDINTPKADWLDRVRKVIEYCVKMGITPILCTIPTAPDANPPSSLHYHEGKNKWIRESGYRYIDFAKAVNAQADGTWASGCLSSDGVHPTKVGAKALAFQVLEDFPEIATND